MAYIESAVASNFPTAYVRVASQTYVLQHIWMITNICITLLVALKMLITEQDRQ